MSFDVVTVGRVNMDLHSQDIGAAFEDITGFDAMVGGSPTNVAIGTSRLGLRSIALTAVGDDRVGDFVLRYLANEGVITDYIPRKAGKLTSLVLVGVQPPDQFPLSFYREDPADIHLTIEEAAALPWDRARSVLISADAFSRGQTAKTAEFVAAAARERRITLFLDLDLRPALWPSLETYRATIRPLLAQVDVAMGTEEEFAATLGIDAKNGLDHEVSAAAADGGALVLKRGAAGAAVFTGDERLDVSAVPVEAVNTVGAGDAFASGLIRSRLLGWDWRPALHFANACGALQVTRHGCSAVFPTETEVEAFAAAHGGG